MKKSKFIQFAFLAVAIVFSTTVFRVDRVQADNLKSLEDIKPEVTSNGKDIIFGTLPEYFDGGVWDTIGYWEMLKDVRYTTACSVGDEIQVDFGDHAPKTLTLNYDANTNPAISMYYQSKPVKIIDSFVILEEHINPVNKDVMYRLTADWENGDKVEFAFLIETDSDVVPVRPDYPIVPPSSSLLISRPIKLELTEQKQTPPPHIMISNITVIRDVSQFTTVNLDGITLENVKPYGFEDKVYLPIRPLAEALQYDIKWNAALHSVGLSNRNRDREVKYETLDFIIDSNSVLVTEDAGENTVPMSANVMIQDGVAYMSLDDIFAFLDVKSANYASEIFKPIIDADDGSTLFLQSY